VLEVQRSVDVLVLTGPPAAGKNTVGRLVADRLARSTLVDADQVRAMVRRPHIAPWYEGEGTAQLRLGVRNTCQLARAFVAEGYAVIALDFLTEETLGIYRAELASLRPRIVRLLPTLDEAQRRNRERGLWVQPDRVDSLYAQIATLDGVDETIDNTDVDAAALAEELSALVGGRHP
jgi:hypothetical protein